MFNRLKNKLSINKAKLYIYPSNFVKTFALENCLKVPIPLKYLCLHVTLECWHWYHLCYKVKRVDCHLLHVSHLKGRSCYEQEIQSCQELWQLDVANELQDILAHAQLPPCLYSQKNRVDCIQVSQTLDIILYIG